MEETLSEIAELGGPNERVVGKDILGGPATMLEALLLERDERVRYLPGTAVNKLGEASEEAGRTRATRATPS